MRFEGEARIGLLGRLVAEMMGHRGRSDTEAILARWEAMATGNEPLRRAP